jgi:hypothetical protein
MLRFVRFLTVVSGVFLLLHGALFMLASTAPGPFNGLTGLLFAFALLVVGTGLLMRRGGLRLYPFAIILPVVPLVYAVIYASAVVLDLVPPPPPAPGYDTNWGFVAFALIPSATAAIALLLLLIRARQGRPASG